MLNIGTGEIIFIAVAALLILGPTKLPEFARTIGKLVREFRRQTDDVRTTVEREFYKMDEALTELPAPEPQPAPEAIAHGAAEALPMGEHVPSQALEGTPPGEPVALPAPSEPVAVVAAEDAGPAEDAVPTKVSS